MPEEAPHPELSRRRLPPGAALTTAAAVAAAAPASGTMLLTWLGHSCFRLEKDGFTVVIDPGIVAPANALAGAARAVGSR